MDMTLRTDAGDNVIGIRREMLREPTGSTRGQIGFDDLTENFARALAELRQPLLYLLQFRAACAQILIRHALLLAFPKMCPVRRESTRANRVSKFKPIRRVRRPFEVSPAAIML